MSGAGVNRSAARKASEVAAARQARRAAHEAAVTAAVGLYFDRSERAAQVREEAGERARRIITEAETAAALLDRDAEAAVARLKELGEPVVEIAGMTGLPVSGVRAAVTRAGVTPAAGLDLAEDSDGQDDAARGGVDVTEASGAASGERREWE
ncbi:hypothetical protein [Micromonospora pisi]|uniref:hypothetical protein n=1 Tax=Micromonospora pisi TaxID=589240 RepID=UPI001B881E49|nr:hypothetical protein [Micromonospora pisi]